MEIRLEGIGKRFRREWIFRNVNVEFSPAHRYAIVGSNGSGKSTLLHIISFLLFPTEGKISCTEQKSVLQQEDLPFLFSFSAPYQELIEEFTGKEMFDFHFQFRNLTNSISSKDFFEEIQLGGNEHKEIKYFSSGMKQRLRLALCAYTSAQAYVLDEPSTNLDQVGIRWYQRLMENIPSTKIVIISSNIKEEYHFCDTVLPLAHFKTH